VARTPRECAILKALMSAPGRIFTRDELIRRIYPRAEAVVIDRVVDVHIGRVGAELTGDTVRICFELPTGPSPAG
jgi:DNA-binding response OmpR family regulator